MKCITRVLQLATLLLVIGLLSPCVPVVRSDTPAAGVAGVSTAHIQEFLRAHNRWRAEVGVPNLTWSNAVAAGAQEWATKLAASGTLQHASSGFGENLSMSSGPQTPTEVVDNWGSEKAKCNYKGEPIGSQACEVGHYTQIVWRNSTELGCGVARVANGATFWVCRYNPAGNVIGEKPY